MNDDQFSFEGLVEDYSGELYNANPDCEHVVVEMPSGVECARCGGWFCV